ncbi:MAG: QueT transporter family protein [Acholeplasmatales bacterium]|jgi:uncharacterized membrane protein|nr:QueT transporter family protein [Acholeplasmatales bacterium]
MKLNVRELVINAFIASIYIVLVVVNVVYSFGALQFRIAEILMILILFNKKYIYGLTLGCFIANVFSTLGWIDMVFGTLATFIPLLLMILTKKILPVYIRLLLLSIFNGIIVGIELSIVFGDPIVFNMIYVFVGEFVVTFILGLPLYYLLLKNKKVKSILENKNEISY